MASQGCLLLVLGFFVWVLIGIAWGFFQLHAPKIIPVAITLVLIGLLAWVRHRQLSAVYDNVKLVLSPMGVVQFDGHTRQVMAWPDMRGIAPVRPWMAKQYKTMAGTAASKGLADGVVAASNAVLKTVMAAKGIIGSGQIEILAKGLCAPASSRSWADSVSTRTVGRCWASSRR